MRLKPTLKGMNNVKQEVEKPKKKKLIHLQHTNGCAKTYKTNPQIKNSIKEFGGL